MHRKTNHVRSTVHISDVISSVSRSIECTKIISGRPHSESLQRSLSDPLAGFKRPTSRAPASKGKKGMRWEGNHGRRGSV